MSARPLSSHTTPTRRTVLAAGTGTAVATAALSACSGAEPVPQSSEAVAAVLPEYTAYADVEPDLAAEQGRSSAGFFAYPANPVSFSDSTPGDGQPITAMGPASFAVPATPPQNRFWTELNERLGSDLEITLTPAADYDARFATSVAGDALPDVFHVGTTQSLPRFMTAKAADLTEHLAGGAIADYPGLATIPTDSWRDCVFEGRIRAIPIQRGLVNLPTVFTRDDLLEAAGIAAAPVDFAELLAQSTALTGGNRWAWGSIPLPYVRSMLDVPSIWSLQDGEFTSTLRDERHQEALEATRRLAEAGVLNPDAAAAPTATRKQWFGAGTSCFHEDSLIAWFSLYTQFSSDPAFRISALPVVGFDGGAGTQLVPNPNFGITAFNAESDRIETLLRVADHLAAPFGTEEYLFQHYGSPGVHYELDGSDPVAIGNASAEIQMGSLYVADAARVVYSPGRRDTVQDAWDHQRLVTERKQADPTTGLYSEAATRKLGSLQGTLSSVEQDIVLGRRPVSDWSAAVDEFLSGGGQEIADEYTTAAQATA